MIAACAAKARLLDLECRLIAHLAAVVEPQITGAHPLQSCVSIHPRDHLLNKANSVQSSTAADFDSPFFPLVLKVRFRTCTLYSGDYCLASGDSGWLLQRCDVAYETLV